MFRTLLIEGYRGFRVFQMEQLGRVNLLVGTNNSGKTSILEALHLLASEGNPSVIWRILARRGERLDREDTRGGAELDLSHLFYGHEFRPGSSFGFLSTSNYGPRRSLAYHVSEVTRGQSPDLFSPRDEAIGSRMVLTAVSDGAEPYSNYLLSRRGGITLDALDSSRRARRESIELMPARFVSTESLSVSELAAMWNQIVLTDAENRVLSALRFLEPKIERIAPLTNMRATSATGSRGGFLVKMADQATPIPIGSLGDGTWRMLALAISLAEAAGGVLLVDEIDTGLHYTVMSGMWKIIFEAAKTLDIQVFATTHSYDCVQSLAELSYHSGDDGEITIQRIEPENSRAVLYSGKQIRIAATRDVEVR